MIQYAAASRFTAAVTEKLDAPPTRGMTMSNDLTRPPRRTESGARREAAGRLPQRRRDRAAEISNAYREGGNSGAIRTEADALAYALARMPATYAAVIASLKR